MTPITDQCPNCEVYIQPYLPGFERFKEWNEPQGGQPPLEEVTIKAIPEPDDTGNGVVRNSVVIKNFECVCGILPVVEVIKRSYTSGEIALYVEAEFNGRRETVLIASCLVPGTPEGFVAIKGFSENRGILLTLVRAGVVAEPDQYFNGMPICRVLF